MDIRALVDTMKSSSTFADREEMNAAAERVKEKLKNDDVMTNEEFDTALGKNDGLAGETTPEEDEMLEIAQKQLDDGDDTTTVTTVTTDSDDKSIMDKILDWSKEHPGASDKELQDFLAPLVHGISGDTFREETEQAKETSSDDEDDSEE